MRRKALIAMALCGDIMYGVPVTTVTLNVIL